jgi:hypothetical protein
MNEGEEGRNPSRREKGGTRVPLERKRIRSFQIGTWRYLVFRKRRGIGKESSEAKFNGVKRKGKKEKDGNE